MKERIEFCKAICAIGAPISISISHLLQDFLDVFVCCLYCPIHLGSIGNWIMVMNFELSAQGVIMSLLRFLDCPLWWLGQAISTFYIIFDKASYLLFHQICGQGSLNLFSEYVPFGTLRVNHTYLVNAPHWEGPLACMLCNEPMIGWFYLHKFDRDDITGHVWSNHFLLSTYNTHVSNFLG